MHAKSERPGANRLLRALALRRAALLPRISRADKDEIGVDAVLAVGGRNGAGRVVCDARSSAFSHRTWEKLRLSQGPWISEVRQPALDRFGKEIAHLNYHRVTLAEQARGWPVVQIAGAIGEVLWVFGANVDQSRVITDFKVRAEREIPAFARLGSWPGAIAPVWPRASATQTLSTRAGEAG
jgi:hypothetical protein